MTLMRYILSKLLSIYKERKLMLEKMMAKYKKTPATEAPKEGEETKAVEKQPIDPVKVQEWTDKLVAYVYDEELAAELAPVFAALEVQEDFSKVIELLDSKEKQIEAITAGGSAAKSDPEQKGVQVKPKNEQEGSPDAADILKQRYAKK